MVLEYRKRSGIAMNEVIIQAQDLVKIYKSKKGIFSSRKEEVKALDHVSFEIKKGQIVGLIGESGCGKTTVGKALLNLLPVDGGKVIFQGKCIYDIDNHKMCSYKEMEQLRRHMQIIFQNPASCLNPKKNVEQLVSEGVKKHKICSKSEVREYCLNILKQCGLEEKCLLNYPSELSGGQKRRVAIAGVLAMEPDIIILDEPTAGLDPKGRDKILKCIKDLHDKKGIGVILVSHSMEDVANYAERIIVMNKGKVMYDDSPHKVFSHYKELEKMGLAAPQITYIMHILKEKGFNVDEDIINLEEAKESILKSIGR